MDVELLTRFLTKERWGKVGVPRESQENEPEAGIWDDINEDHLGRQ